MVAWYSLYVNNSDQQTVAARFRACLGQLGYVEFNAFGLMPGRVYPDAVRLFVTPPQGAWVRVIAEKPLAFALPAFPRVLEVALEGEAIRVFVEGALTDTVAALADFPCSERALTAPFAASASDSVGGIPLDALPDDVRQMASGIDPQQAGKLFNRLSASVLGKVGGAAGDAQDLLKTTDWNTPNGQRIRRVLACLQLDSAPDFVTLRDAYALHERRRRNPKANLYPGDAEALQAVPNALDFIPLYAGRD